MKKVYLFAAFIAAAIFAVSCSVSQIDGEPVGPEPGDPEALEVANNIATIEASISEDLTKTRMFSDIDGYNFEWSRGDCIYLTEFNLGKILHGDFDYYNYFESNSLSSGGSTATFTIDYGKSEMPEDTYGDGYTRYFASYPNPVVVAYPVDEYGTMNPKSDPDHAVFIVDIPTFQYPTTDCFDPDADIMVSPLYLNPTRPHAFNLKFARVGAVLKLRLTGLPAGYLVDSGSIETDAQGGQDWGPAYQEAYDPLYQRTFQPDKPAGIQFYPDEVYVDEDGVATIWLRVKGGTLRDLTLSCEVYVMQGKGKSKHYGYSVDLRETHQVVPFCDGGCTSITLGCNRIYDIDASTYGPESISSSTASIPVSFDLDEIPFESVTYGVCYNESAINDDPTIEFDNCKVAESVSAEGEAAILIDNLKANTEYAYRSYVTVDGKTTYSTVWYLTTDVSYTAPTPVDLGLPSGVKWSPYNLGAESPEEGGYFFRWGEEDAYSFYSGPWYNYKHSTGNNYYSFDKYVSNIVVGTHVDHKRVLEAADDPATYNLGNQWRTACSADYEELISNCTLSLEDVNGVECFKFTSNINGNSIYFPKSGNEHSGTSSGSGEFGKCWCSDMPQPIERDMSGDANCILFRVDGNGDPYYLFDTNSKAEYANAVRPVSGGAGVARQVAWTYEPSSVGTTSVTVGVKFDLTAIPGYEPNGLDHFDIVYCKKSKRISYTGKENRPAPTYSSDYNVRINEVSDGVFYVSILDLDPGTEYVYRAYAYLANSSKSYYGETYSFTTH